MENVPKIDAPQPVLCRVCEANAHISARDGKNQQQIIWCNHDFGRGYIGVLSIAYARSGIVTSWQNFGPALKNECEALANTYMDTAEAAGIRTERGAGSMN